MSDGLNERSRQILEAIIEDHIDSAEPVGSRAVTRRHPLGLSPATVRNVMADLEDLGYLCSPHTSAGRVPTEKGYRFYVDTLLKVRPLSDAEQLGIASQYQLKGLPMEELLRQAGQVLSGLSRYAGVVLAPRVATTVFRHIEFVRLSQVRILVVLVTRSGLVQNKLIESDDTPSQSELDQISNYLNQILSGLTLPQIRQKLLEEMSQEKALYDQLLGRALRLSEEAFGGDMEEKVFIEGTSNILDQPEFADVGRMRRLFRTFEQKSQLLDLLDKSQQAQGVQIFIGSESEYHEIEGCSLVTSTYGLRGGAVGSIGVIGPSRMPYSMVIPIVDYTARLITQVLNGTTSQER
ncbi:MAG: heat-inducible transcription repressor HrcA [Desulfuromonas sp.]|nr:MAG: heat-inducible transcription repressor HrcA [Desulfuromonas sp.]